MGNSICYIRQAMNTVNSYHTTALFYHLNEAVAELNGFEEAITRADINNDNDLRLLIRQFIVPHYQQFNPASKEKILLALRYCIFQLTSAQLFALYEDGMPLLHIPREYAIRHFYELIAAELNETPALSDEEIRQLQDLEDDTEVLSQ